MYKCASADARLEDSWDEALASGEALSVRDVKRSREINQVRFGFRINRMKPNALGFGLTGCVGFRGLDQPGALGLGFRV